MHEHMKVREPGDKDEEQYQGRVDTKRIKYEEGTEGVGEEAEKRQTYTSPHKP